MYRAKKRGCPASLSVISLISYNVYNVYNIIYNVYRGTSHQHYHLP